jgi:ABC-type antimicrobial peptide transport system permease subunit
MNDVIADALTFERLENWLFGTFAALAALLAVLGLYGLISHEVEISTRDIGVRMALGATPMRILRFIYSRVGVMLFGGVVMGLAMIWVANRLIASVVTVSIQQDTLLVAALCGGLLCAGAIAAFLPARRAATVDPTESLRSE